MAKTKRSDKQNGKKPRPCVIVVISRTSGETEQKYISMRQRSSGSRELVLPIADKYCFLSNREKVHNLALIITEGS